MSKSVVEKKGLPDFIIAGAPRSGTTWLVKVLMEHPNIYLAQPIKPEPKFFLVDEIYKKGIEYYSKTWFSDIPADALVSGEKSTNYMESPDAARRIKSHLPQVKLIFLLRNPIERAHSNYLWTKMNGLENLSFLEALKAEKTREENYGEKLKYARPFSYASRGLYSELLKIYFELFNKEQILFLNFDVIKTSPQKMAAKVHEFLGVKVLPEAGLLGVVNESEGNKKIPTEALEYLIPFYKDENAKLVNALGNDFNFYFEKSYYE